MPSLFGVDFASEIAAAFAGELVAGTLISVAPGTRGNDPTAGTNPTSTSYTFEGIIEEYSQSIIDGDVIRVGDRRVLILAGSLRLAGAAAGVVPKSTDRITIEGTTYTIVGIPQRDPAAATYSCQCRGL